MRLRRESRGEVVVLGVLGAALAGCGAIAGTLAAEDDMQTRWERTADQPMVIEAAIAVTEADRVALTKAGAIVVGSASVRGDTSMTALRNRAQRLGATNGATHCFLPPASLESTMLMAECVSVPQAKWASLPQPLRPTPKK